MEIKQKNISGYDLTHPNFRRWERGRRAAFKRGKVVKDLITTIKLCNQLNILDLGSGEGGTSAVLSQENNVISYDINLIRLKRQRFSDGKYSILNGDAESLPFRDSSFDLIIMQDVIEHIDNRRPLVNELSRVLKKEGIIYVSTPNRYSVVNIISDPHWGIPLLALFKRPAIKKYFLRFLRKKDLHRSDTAELLSLNELAKLFSGFNVHLKTKEAVQILSKSPDGLLWSSFHLLIYNMLKKAGLLFLLNRAANNRSGIINKYFSPTFYLILIRI